MTAVYVPDDEVRVTVGSRWRVRNLDPSVSYVVKNVTESGVYATASGDPYDSGIVYAEEDWLRLFEPELQ